MISLLVLLVNNILATSRGYSSRSPSSSYINPRGDSSGLSFGGSSRGGSNDKYGIKDIDLGCKSNDIRSIFYSNSKESLFELTDITSKNTTAIMKKATFQSFKASETSKELKESEKLLGESEEQIEKIQAILDEYDHYVSVRDNVLADIAGFRSALKNIEINMKPENFKKNLETKAEIAKLKEEIKTNNSILNKMEAENINLRETLLEEESVLRKKFPNIDLGIEKKIQTTEENIRQKHSESRELTREVDALKSTFSNIKEDVDRLLRINGKVHEDVDSNRKFLKDFRNGTFEKLCQESQEKIESLRSYLNDNREELIKLQSLNFSLKDQEELIKLQSLNSKGQEELIKSRSLNSKDQEEIKDQLDMSPPALRKNLTKLNKQKNEILQKIILEMGNTVKSVEKSEKQASVLEKSVEDVLQQIENLKLKISEFYDQNFEFLQGIMLKKHKINLKMVDIFENIRMVDMKIGEVEVDLIYDAILMGVISFFICIYGIYVIRSK